MSQDFNTLGSETPQPTTPPASPLPVSAELQPIPVGDKSSIDQIPKTNPENTVDDVPIERPFWKSALSFLISWALIPGLLVLFVHNFVFQAWYVEGESMQPTFQNGDYLIVSKFDASWHKLTGTAGKLDLKRGDVVIFNPPGLNSDVFFIKRVIGLPGERVVIKDGIIKIFNKQYPDGETLNETYTANIPLEGDIDKTIPDNQIFAVGDNRNPNASHDSRAIGPIPMERIVGTAALRLLPVSQFGTVAHPTYSGSSSIKISPTPESAN